MPTTGPKICTFRPKCRRNILLIRLPKCRASVNLHPLKEQSTNHCCWIDSCIPWQPIPSRIFDLNSEMEMEYPINPSIVICLCTYHYTKRSVPINLKSCFDIPCRVNEHF